MKQYIADLRYRENGELKQDYITIVAPNIKDAKTAASNIAKQRGIFYHSIYEDKQPKIIA